MHAIIRTSLYMLSTPFLRLACLNRLGFVTFSIRAHIRFLYIALSYGAILNTDTDDIEAQHQQEGTIYSIDSRLSGFCICTAQLGIWKQFKVH